MVDLIDEHGDFDFSRGGQYESFEYFAVRAVRHEFGGALRHDSLGDDAVDV